jgi:hypothetical protein
MFPYKRYRCRYCHVELPAWLPAFQAPNGALLLDHLSAMQSGPTHPLPLWGVTPTREWLAGSSHGHCHAGLST